MNTTGWRPDSLAAATCSASRAVTVLVSVSGLMAGAFTIRADPTMDETWISSFNHTRIPVRAQEPHRNARHGLLMTDSHPGSGRQQQVRRTTRARRGVVAVGAVGALGTAIAIGVTTQASGTTDTTQQNGSGDRSGSSTDDQGAGGDLGGDQQFDQSTPDSGQFASPGNGAPQAHSGGS